MEGNAKSSLQWDWENLIMFNAKTTEYPKKLRSSYWAIDGEGSLDFGCFYSSPGVGVGGGSGSDVGHASSKSSISASNNSSSIGELQIPKFTPSEDFHEGISTKKDYASHNLTGSSPTFDASVGPGEPLLGLKLGKRTYFEDVFTGSNSKTPLSVNLTSSEIPTKKSKINCLRAHAQCCQVEGCNLDLRSAKSYHRKHRVCENHTKCPMVIVGGQERRFCQQCSRFHGLSEFDEKKRSCRRRLTDHNARRRKPQPEAARLNQGRLSSFNDSNFPWESTCGTAFTITTGYSHQLPAPTTRASHDSNRLLSSRVTTSEILQGLEESGICSNMETSQDLHRALSLLSNNSWSPSEQKATSLDHSTHTGLLQPATCAIAQSPECWHAQQESAESRVHAPGDGSFQEFRLLRTPYDSVFYPN